MTEIDDKTRATTLFLSTVLFRAFWVGAGLLAVMSFLTLALLDPMYEVHSYLIEIPQPEYNVLIFDFLGDMKVLILVLFLVPACAIRWTLKASK